MQDGQFDNDAFCSFLEVISNEEMSKPYNKRAGDNKVYDIATRKSKKHVEQIKKRRGQTQTTAADESDDEETSAAAKKKKKAKYNILQLEHLNLARNAHLSDPSMFALSAYLPSTLTHLNLADWHRCSGAAFGALFSSIKRCTLRLESLVLSNTGLGFKS